jgi:glycosyltransferase involved in cell wall biosynthesis
MKTVCILLQNYYDFDVRVRRKAETLTAAGYEVDVIALRSPNSSPPRYNLNGVNVHTIPLGKKRSSRQRYLFEYVAFFFLAFWKLSFPLRKRNYSLVDVNNLPDFLVFAAFRAKWKGAKVVLDMHEITPEFYMSKYGIKEDSWLIGFLKMVESISMRFADHVITINAPIQQLLERRGLAPERSTVIMNCVDEALFHSVRSNPGRGDTPVADNPFVMMYHGTLTKIYGLDIAIEAFSRARQQIPRAEFWIVGSGSEKNALESLARTLELDSKVKFVGMLPPEEIPQWLNRCDIGVLATRRDTFLDLSFSNKLSEYIIMEKAVICPSLKAIRHYFSEEALAFFQPNDPGDLARQMVRLYENPRLRERFASKALEEYAPIRWAVMKERYLNLTADLLAGKPGLFGAAPEAVASSD